MKTPHQPPVLAIQVGNSRIKLAVFRGEDPDETVFVPCSEAARAAEEAMRLFESIGEDPEASVLVASVNAPISEPLVGALRDQLGHEIYIVPDDMPVPIGLCLAPGAQPGVDRLLNAAAAWHRLRQACIVIDAGTCITVDFIDGEGVFHGGAIAPGLRMQLAALHRGTAGLPEIGFETPAFEVPEGSPWGADTREAMLRGVYHGARGLAWRLIEKYAEAYGGFPLVVATGGDAAALFGDDELVNQVVPDLVLRGMAIAARSALEPEDSDPLAGAAGSARGGAGGFGRLGAAGGGFSLLPDDVDRTDLSSGGAMRGRADDAVPGEGNAHGRHGDDDGCGCGHDHAHD